MTEKLRAHIENLFKDAPRTKQAVEIKEEILQNTIDRYNDLLSEGKSEEAAYNISVAGIGDVSHIISSLMAPTAMSGYTREEIASSNKKRALLLSVAIMLYVCCVVPLIALGEIAPEFGLALMFLMIAAATGLIIYRNGIKLDYNKSDDTVVENFKEWNQRSKEEKSVRKAVNALITAFTLAIYFLISFTTGAWHITWIIFLISVAVRNVAAAIMDLIK